MDGDHFGSTLYDQQERNRIKDVNKPDPRDAEIATLRASLAASNARAGRLEAAIRGLAAAHEALDPVAAEEAWCVALALAPRLAPPPPTGKAVPAAPGLRPCPECGNGRAVDSGTLIYCPNCRKGFPAEPPPTGNEKEEA